MILDSALQPIDYSTPRKLPSNSLLAKVNMGMRILLALKEENHIDHMHTVGYHVYDMMATMFMIRRMNRLPSVADSSSDILGFPCALRVSDHQCSQ